MASYPLPSADELLPFAAAGTPYREIRRRENALKRGDLVTAFMVLALTICTIEPHTHRFVKASSLGQFFQGSPTAVAVKAAVGTAPQPTKVLEGAPQTVVMLAESWVGQRFKPGVQAQCSVFVRHVFQKAGLPLGSTQNPFDKAVQFNEGSSHPARAQSLFGEEVGQFIRNKAELKPGDLVAFKNTYGKYGDGAITHVAIYIGNGMMVDRPTASRPVQKRSLNTFRFAVGLRPHVYKN